MIHPPTSSALSSLVFPLAASGSDSSPLSQLTAGLAAGSNAAWAEFHRDYGPGIFRQLLAATRGDHDLASEALQQTYLRIARHARPCDSAPEFAAWLRIVARTALSDSRRRQWRFIGLLRRREADPTGIDSSAAHEERLQLALDSALALLAPDDRALLEAKYFSGLDVRTLAERLAISPKAAESRLTRARAELRRHLVTILPRDE